MAASSQDVSTFILADYFPQILDQPVSYHAIDMDGLLLCSRINALVSAKTGIPECLKEIYTVSTKDMGDIRAGRVSAATILQRNYEKYGITEAILNNAIRSAFEETHDALIEIIKESTVNGEHVYLSSGSSRQTRALDDENSNRNKNGSSAVALNQFFHIIKEHLHDSVKLDGFLLEDMVRGKKPGAHFSQMLIEATLAGIHLEASDNHSKIAVDDEKLILLYTLMHRIASLHPSQPIAFHFYDDDPGPDEHPEKGAILETLSAFFKKYPHTMPENVTLHLHQYVGPKTRIDRVTKEVTNIDVRYERQQPEEGIKGEGKVNANYARVLNDAKDCLTGTSGSTHRHIGNHETFAAMLLTATTPAVKQVEDTAASTTSIPREKRGNRISHLFSPLRPTRILRHTSSRFSLKSPGTL